MKLVLVIENPENYMFKKVVVTATEENFEKVCAFHEKINNGVVIDAYPAE